MNHVTVGELAVVQGTTTPRLALQTVSTISGDDRRVRRKDTAPMADRVLRGSRLGATSYETDRDHDLAPRRSVRYDCPKGHDFEVPFADDAEPPTVWECRLHGVESKLIDGSDPEPKKAKPPRTHWDMLLERRTVSELEELLTERLEELKGRRTRSA